MDKNNEHQMVTRSKRKRTGCDENMVLQISDSSQIVDSNFIELSEDFLKNEEEEEEIDYELEQKILNNRKRRKLPSDLEDFIIDDECLEKETYYEEEDDITKSERELADALSCYINKNLERLEKEEEEENNTSSDIILDYDAKMKKYFLKLDDKEQNNIIKLEEEIKTINNEIVPLRYQILNSNMDIKIKAVAIKKLNSIQKLDDSAGEYYKLKNYIDGLMEIPFGIYRELPINKNNNPKDITNYMLGSSQILDKAVYSHQKAKAQIMQILGKWISNPQAKGSVFSIVGPMGNGKTTLVKEGIAKMINRPFEFISLGGASDSCFLDGHSYTYEGATPGRIVEILKKSKCMNPVIYFDELDKVSDTPKGQEIINLLIHLTDFSQNDSFTDKYYSDIPLDLSKALFIFSLNNIDNVNPILRDRMMMIQTDKLSDSDKVTISKDYIIPKILSNTGFSDFDIQIPENVIEYCIQKYSEEEGVRNLKRCYETLFEKINILRLIGGLQDTNISNQMNFSSSMEKLVQKKFTFPLYITIELVSQLIDENNVSNQPPFMMYS